MVEIFANVTSVEMPLSPDLTNHQYSTLWHRELATEDLFAFLKFSSLIKNVELHIIRDRTE